MKRFRRWAAIILLLLVLATLLVFFAASKWLETPAGRHLLQQELGKGLGVNADLQGEYALELFPAFRIDGQQLHLSDRASGQVLARLESYQLHLALWPLLKQQIIIYRVAASDGFVDLDLLAGQTEGTGQSTDSTGELPTIRALELTHLGVLKSTDELLMVDHLQLEDFIAGQKSSVRLGLSLPGDQAMASLVEIQGEVQLVPEPLSVALDIDTASVRINGQALPVGSGKLGWSQVSGEVAGMINGNLAGYSSQVELTLATRPAMEGDISATFLSIDQRNITADIAFREDAGLWLFQPVLLELDGQHLAGQGCLILDERVRLQAQLRSDELDFDRLQSLLPEGLMTDSGAPQVAGNPLPFDLAVELHLGKASASGAEATDVRVLLGNPPDCGGNVSTESQ
jgi:hypothetical protein